ncbi:uncharacterized protein LOC110702800 [Chenopodium quinoa]|uniref:uncharacterized protein LOC110702800 n=1 Tax=Chenopodium quinoa TaxID=63459 RepID=UPI000B77079B|nr:uncharacterized protein LOC110702800 [Chenopodium quinoa]
MGNRGADSGYMADSSSGIVQYSNEPLAITQGSSEQDLMVDSDLPVPMDCSPPISPRPSTPPSPTSTDSGDKMWSWVKEGCSRKRTTTSHESAIPPLIVGDTNSAILACLEPFKKRRGDPKGGGSLASSSSEDKLSSLAFDGFCGSDALGLSGGLVVFWFAPVSVVPVSISLHVIFCKAISTKWRSPFTWTNGQLGNPTFERLDKGYASCSWLESYPDAMIIHQTILFSDHAAIVLKESSPHFSRKTPYRIENWCLDIREISLLINSAWDINLLGSQMFVLSQKLMHLRHKTLRWLSLPDQKISQAHNLFLYCKQSSKVRWDAFGETNSHLLFSSVQDWRRRNKIFSLKDTHGNWISDPMGIENLLFQHFSDLYNCQKNPSSNIPDLWENLDIPVLSSLHQQQLIVPFSAAEIKDAIFHIGNDKSPGPDGFTAAFFKSHWSTVGKQVTSAIQYFFARGYMLKDWNRTFLVLLPKVDHPDNPSQFRPFGLCNVLYKCIAKCMTARLRKILPILISESQSAFVPGRLMSDNSLIAHEMLSYMNSSTSKICSAALKLDMNKAYDRVNWEFLWDVLKAFGFPPYWIQLIKQCVSTVSYQILINGKPSSVLRPACGLRQGDLLSPYLFVLCMEIFSLMLRQAEGNGLFQGVRISRRAPSMVNVQKSFVKFSSNTPEDYRDFLSSALHMQTKKSLGSYLGLPVDLGRAKCHQFQSLVDKVTQKLSAFGSRHLPEAAKLVLINTVVIASLNHVLSVFKLPVTISDQIGRLLSRFWWKNNSSSRGLALTPSASLYLLRGLGGLGIRHVPSFNSALLAKQMWRLIHNPQLLVSRIYRARYPRLVNYKASSLPSRPSWGCRSLLEGACVLSHGVIWKVGSGSQVNITDDDWVPGVSVRFKDAIPSDDLPTVVSQIIDPGSHAWDSTRIRQCEFTSLVRSSHHLEVIRTLPLDRDFSAWFTDSISGFVAAKDWHGLDEILAFFWAIWLARNNLRFRSEVCSLAGIYVMIASWLSRSKEAKELSDCLLPSCPPGFGVSCLHDLHLGVPSVQFDICLTYDGSWNAKDQRAGMGWFLSSDLSSPVVGGGAQAGFASSALHSELFACLLGLRQVRERSYTSVRFCTDCMSILTLIGGQSSASISNIWILREIRQIIAGLQRFQIQKVSREEVGYAHHLTKLACSRHFIYFRF